MPDVAAGIRCPQCGSGKLWRDGVRTTSNGDVQRWLCRDCSYRFSEKKSLYLGPIRDSLQKPIGDRVLLAEEHAKSMQFSIDKGAIDCREHISSAIPAYLAANSQTMQQTERGVGQNSSQLANQQSSELVEMIDTKTLKRKTGIPNDRQIRAIQINEAKNLVAAIEEKQAAGISPQLAADAKGKIIQHAVWMQKEGYAESTISRRIRLLGTLVNKGANLDDPESLKETIAKQQKWTTKTKEIAVEAYSCLLKMQGKTWNPPKYQAARKLPFIPTEQEVNSLIAGCNRKTATFLQLLKETGMRCGEAFILEWTDFDLENKTVSITPEKGSEPRQLRISTQLIAMLNNLPREKAKPFDCSERHFARTFRLQRSKIANKLKNDRIRKIHFHTLRHWKATMEYAKTKDIIT